jgi:hypothetical protein
VRILRILSLVLVASVATALIFLLLAVEPSSTDVHDITAVVFQASGTIVALALPAAQFANVVIKALSTSG